MRKYLLITTLLGSAMAAGCNGGGEPAQQQDAGESSSAQQSPAAATATGEEVSVRFVSPEDGARVQSPFQVEMAAEGVKVAKAGTMEDGTGHMHVLVDVPFVPPGMVIPNDQSHIHFGDGSTTAKLDLAPGEHVLRLQFADGAHRTFEGDEYRDLMIVHISESTEDTSTSVDSESTEDTSTSVDSESTEDTSTSVDSESTEDASGDGDSDGASEDADEQDDGGTN